jgi:hypothetical protein
MESSTRSRGGDTIIIFWCESGHRWGIGYFFHKGMIFTKLIILDKDDNIEEF